MTQLQTINQQNLAVSSPNADEWTIIREQSEMLIKTGFLPQSIKTPEQAVAIILQGRELGIPTMAALGTINVIQGKPTVSPQLMLALINRSGQLENIQITNDADGVTCTMKRRNRAAHTEYFGVKEATALGLIAKDNYKKQAMTMFRWRVIAACARTVFPDVVLGLYTPDEMGANTDAETGEVLAEPATLHRIPTKASLTESIRQKETEAIDGEIVEERQTAASATRDEIENLLKEIGIDPKQSLEKYDRIEPGNGARKAEFLHNVRVKFIKDKIASDTWTLTEEGTAEFLAQSGVEGIDNADFAAIAETVRRIRTMEDAPF